jgi:hypothetical protein
MHLCRIAPKGNVEEYDDRQDSGRDYSATGDQLCASVAQQAGAKSGNNRR